MIRSTLPVRSPLPNSVPSTRSRAPASTSQLRVGHTAAPVVVGMQDRSGLSAAGFEAACAVYSTCVGKDVGHRQAQTVSRQVDNGLIAPVWAATPPAPALQTSKSDTPLSVPGQSSPAGSTSKRKSAGASRQHRRITSRAPSTASGNDLLLGLCERPAPAAPRRWSCTDGPRRAPDASDRFKGPADDVFPRLGQAPESSHPAGSYLARSEFG